MQSRDDRKFLTRVLFAKKEKKLRRSQRTKTSLLTTAFSSDSCENLPSGVTRRNFVDLFGTDESRTATLNSFWKLKNEMPGCVQKCIREKYFLLEQVPTLRDLRGLLICHSDIMFIKPVELYWISNVNKYFNMGCASFRWEESPCRFMMYKIVHTDISYYL